MHIEKTPIEGLETLHYDVFRDHRGFFKRIFCTDDCADIMGGRKIIQINQSGSQEVGTVRGMHLQKSPHAEFKIIQCVKGKVLDVVVDLRAGSDTFLHYHAIELSEKDDKAFIVSEGLAHGFQVLEEDSHLLYFHSCAYAPDAGVTINPNDPAIGIEWSLPITNISEKDENAPFIADDFKGLKI